VFFTLRMRRRKSRTFAIRVAGFPRVSSALNFFFSSR